MEIFSLFFFLLFGHVLADYPLQNDFMARAKNRHHELGKSMWHLVLPAHALIHGGLVALITGSVLLGVAETILHGITDWFKCEGKLSFHADQAIHVGCKVLWTILAFYMGASLPF